MKNNRNRGLLPIGVKKEPKGYSSTCKVNKKHHYLGMFDMVDEAFNSYKEAKEDYIKEVANKWRSSIDNRVYEALMAYQVEITD